MVREMISKMKNSKAAGPLRSMSEMIILIGTARNKTITDLINQV